MCEDASRRSQKVREKRGYSLPAWARSLETSSNQRSSWISMRRRPAGVPVCEVVFLAGIFPDVVQFRGGRRGQFHFRRWASEDSVFDESTRFT